MGAAAGIFSAEAGIWTVAAGKNEPEAGANPYTARPVSPTRATAAYRNRHVTLCALAMRAGLSLIDLKD